MKITLSIGVCLLLSAQTFSQHNNELFNDGALIHVQSGAEIHVLGDVHMKKATAELENNGLIKTHGNSYSDALFQNTGTGTYRIENSGVNTNERQFIQGSFAVRGGQAKIGVDDGSFHNLELANSQGVVYLLGAGNVADVRNSVDFKAGTVLNKIITHDVGLTGAMSAPSNGDAYSAVFGVMNTAAGAGTSALINNTVTLNGDTSIVDSGYVQGKMRYAIASSGGTYNYVLGIHPGDTAAQAGIQYATLNFTGTNNYDYVTGYFQSGSSNAGTAQTECSGNLMDYFGGTNHGEWFFQDSSGVGTGDYTITVWPQDDNMIYSPVWAVTKDDTLVGTADDCSATLAGGVARSGLDGFGPAAFGVAAPTSALPIELIDISANGIVDHIDVVWNVASEYNVSHYELERSEDGYNFEYIASLGAVGTTTQAQRYEYNDFNVRTFQTYYYRVRNVDFDGQYSYTPIVSARIEGGTNGFDANSVSLFPNPTSYNTAVSIVSSEEMELVMTTYTTSGKRLLEQDIKLQPGHTVVQLASNTWSNGVYFVKLRDERTGKVVTKRLVKND